MSHQKQILNNYLLYFLCFIFICLIGVSNVFGAEYTGIGYLDNYSTISVSASYNGGAPIEVPKNSSLNFNQVTNVLIQVSNYNFEANKNYRIEVYLPQQTMTNADTYTITGNNGENCIVSYADTRFTTHYPYFAFQCPTATNYININVYNSNGGYLWQTAQTNIFTWSYSYLLYSQTPISNGDNNTQDIINNQNQNTQNIINNQNQNTQDIINNQNQNTQSLIDDNKKNFQTCHTSKNLLNTNLQTIKSLNTNGIWNDNVYTNDGITITVNEDLSLSVNGTSTSQQTFLLANNINFSSGSYILSAFTTATNNSRIYIWDNSWNNIIDTNYYNNFTLNENKIIKVGINIFRDRSFNNFIIKPMIRFSSISDSSYEPYSAEEICTNKIDDLNDNLTDDDTSEATSEASDFFSDFDTNTFGLTSIITAPLNLISSLTSSSCTALHLPLPYLDNKYLDLPCMSTIYQQNFGAFFTIYQTITYGIIAYWVCVRIFNHVKDFKNPEHDEIEVVDL